jgi:hypothetical protein
MLSIFGNNPKLIIMKKTFIFLLISLFSTSVFSQFKLTIDGFLSEDDEEYLVLNYPDKSSEEMYNQTLMFIHSVYKIPDAVINEVKNEMITVSGFQESAVGFKKVLGAYLATWDMNYTISFQFKDGRVRINAPNFQCSGYSEGQETKLVLYAKPSLVNSASSLFKKDGKPRMKDSIEMIESFFNDFCTQYDNFIKTKETDNDW